MKMEEIKNFDELRGIFVLDYVTLIGIISHLNVKLPVLYPNNAEECLDKVKEELKKINVESLNEIQVQKLQDGIRMYKILKKRLNSLRKIKSEIYKELKSMLDEL